MHPSEWARRRRREARQQRIETALGVSVEHLIERDPLTAEDLPESSTSTELDWVPDVELDAPRPVLWMSGLVAAAVVFALRLLPDWTGTRILYLCIIAVCLAFGAYELLVRKSIRWAFAALLAGPLAVLIVAVQNPLPAFLLFASGLLLVAHLAGRIAHHSGDLRLAQMMATREVRRDWRSLWRPRLLLEHVRAALPRWLGRWPVSGPEAVSERDAVERAQFDQGFLVVVAALLLGFFVLVVTPVPIYAGLFALLTVGAVVWAYAWLSMHHYRAKTGASRRQAREALAHANGAWFGYYADNTPTPAIYRGGSGAQRSRSSFAAAAARVFAAGVVLLGAYFPFLMIAVGPEPWLEQNRETAVARLGDQAPSLATIRTSLPESTRTVAAALPEDAGAAYLDAAATLRYREELAEASLGSLLPLERAPEAWVLLSVWGLFGDFVVFALALALGLLGCAFVPGLLFRGVVQAVAGRAVLHHFRACDESDGAYLSEDGLFDAAVDRITNSSDELERQHLWLGVTKEGAHPVLLDREVLEYHAHIMGGTKTGKTSLGLAPMVHQLISDKSSVIVLDLKGDQTLFEEARARARDVGATFKWFTTESGESTFVFNPLAQSHMRSFTPVERADIYTRALGLDHGEGYGRIHFSRANRAPLLKLLQLEPEVDSFEQLARGLRDHARDIFPTGRSKEHADDLVSVVDNLALIDALNVAPPRPGSDAVEQPLEASRRAELMEHAIDMQDVLEEPGVYYFKLPGALHTASDREVGKFALNALLTAAYKHKGERLPVYLVIDEFQMIASEDLSVVLEQARSMGVRVILSNQSPSQLAKVGRGVFESIQANTGFQQLFSIHDSEYRKVLGELSGETIYAFTSLSEMSSSYRTDGGDMGGTSTVSVTMSQAIGPRFRANDFIRMSAREDECLVHIKYNHGYSLFDGFPFVLYPIHHIDAEEYERRKAATWPDEGETPGTLTGPLPRAAAGVSKTGTLSAKPKRKKSKKPPANQPELPLENPLHDRLDSMEVEDD